MKPGLTLDTFGGDDIATVCAEAQLIADTLNRGCGFQFNGVQCVAVPGGTAAKLAEAQQEAQRSRMIVHSDTIKIEIERHDRP